MSLQLPDSLQSLRSRIADLHGERAAERAERAALLGAALEVYKAAGRRREEGEDRLAKLIDELTELRECERDWACLVHGLMLQVARDVDARRGGT